MNLYWWLSAASHVSSDAQKKLNVPWLTVAKHKSGTIHNLKAINRLPRALQKRKKIGFTRLSVLLQCLTTLNLYICNISQLTSSTIASQCQILKHRKPDDNVSVPLVPLAWAVKCVEHAIHLHGQCVSFTNSSRWSFRVCSKKGSYARVLEKLFLPHTHTHMQTQLNYCEVPTLKILFCTVLLPCCWKWCRES